MLLVKEKNKHRLKAPVFASLSLAFASFGDAFLYPFLPINYTDVGVPVVWIGVLLSINRFVRIISNTWIAHLLMKYGLRIITLLAACLAITSTVGYAIASNVILWLLLRIIWSLAFSALRLSVIGYSLEQSQQGFALGLTRGIQETGPMISLMLGPLLLTYFSIQHTFLILAALSLPAIYFAWNLPSYHYKTSVVRSTSPLRLPSLPNSITFASALLIDGIMVVALGVLLLRFKDNITLLTATSLAAFYLGYRRACLVLLSPAGGWLADRIGIRQIFDLSLFMMIVGLSVLLLGQIEIGTIITFAFYSVHAATTPGYVSWKQDHPLSYVAENATWRDVGAAVGTLAGGFLLSSNYLNQVLTLTTFALAILFIFHWRNSPQVLKLLNVWK